jgi:hypothetical protein
LKLALAAASRHDGIAGRGAIGRRILDIFGAIIDHEPVQIAKSNWTNAKSATNCVVQRFPECDH